MDVKGSITSLRTSVADELNGQKAEDLRIIAWAVLYFFAGLVLSFAAVLGRPGPFGIAAVAAAGAAVNGVCCLVGAAIGYIVSGGLSEGIRYLAAIVIVYTLEFSLQDTKLYKKTFFAPTTAATVTLLTGVLADFTLIVSKLTGIAGILLDTVLSFGATCFFREALESDGGTTEASEARHIGSVMISVSILLMALSGISVFRILSVGRLLAVLMLMISVFRGNSSAGCAIGTSFGIAMDLSAGGVPFYTMAYAFTGLISGLFGRHGRLAFLLSFVLSNAVAAACVWSVGPRIAELTEVFCASVIFMILPSGFISRLGALLRPTASGCGESGLRRYVSKRVAALSSAYSELYEIVRRNVETPKNDTDPAKVFDRAADSVCVRCKEKNRCWNAEYVSTLSALNDASVKMLRRGTLCAEDVPEHFAEKCIMIEAFVTAVNAELRAAAYRRHFAIRLRENRDTAWGQYSDMADILSGVSEELGSSNGADHLAERRLIRYLRTFDIEADTAVYRDGKGRLRAVIESGSLGKLLSDDRYLDELSKVLGMRMCRPKSENTGTGKLVLAEAEPLSVSVGIAAMKKKGEKVSGDRGTYFKTDAGVLCVILSDGMGCGASAASESREVTDILEKFLRSGVDPAVAMKTLNSVMLLKNGENCGFATVDLMCVDLFTGETGFYKYGAAPSYVLNGKSIKRIKCESFAPGLDPSRKGEPDVVRMRLKPGSTAIIASDGVVGGGDDKWLREILDCAGEDMKLLARSTLREAEKQYGSCDDMTVLAVRVRERE